MPLPIATDTFGELLRYVRRRARLTQRELALGVGYTEAHICRMEKNERLPDLTTVAALFVPALNLEDDPQMIDRLLKLAAQARSERMPTRITINQVAIEHQVEVEIGELEEIPPLPAYYVPRPQMVERLRAALSRERCISLSGLAGMGKTALAADVCRRYTDGPVFWHTLIAGVNISADAIVRQLALFLITLGRTAVRPLVENRTEASPIPLDQQLMLIKTALAQQPALLCFDDIHLLEGDAASLSLLQNLAGVPSARLLLVSRVDVPLPVSQVRLGGMEPLEADALAVKLGLVSPDGWVGRLLERTGHSPMLLRLAAGQLLDNETDAAGFIEHLETQPQVANYLLNAILRDLSPCARWLIELIAVFRQTIDLYDATLIELVDRTGQTPCLSDALAELQRRHLVEDAHHALLHPLVRDHVYVKLAMEAAHKRELHAMAAEWSERVPGDRIEAAYHWTRAGDVAQASELIGDRDEWLFDQGQSRAAVLVVDEALEALRRKRGETGRLRGQLLFARGDLLRGTLRAAEAEASYREAWALSAGQPAVRAAIVRNLAQVLMQRGQSAEALRLCQSARAELPPADAVLLARLESIECRAHLVLSHYAEAEQTAQEAIRLAGAFSESVPRMADDVMARSERTLGWVNYTRHPQGEESLAHYNRALDFARRAGLRMVENAVLSNLATAMLERGDEDGARRHYEEALKGYEAMGDLYGTAGILHNLGAFHHGRGEDETALAYFERAGQIERSVGDLEGLLSTEGARASILVSLGKLSEARGVLDGALAEDRGSSDVWTIGTALCLLVEIQLLQGEVSQARATSKRVLGIAGIDDNARMHAWALSGLALVQLAAGELGEAARTVEGDPPDDLGVELTLRWKLVQSAVASACGDANRAQSIARSVAETASRKNFRPALLTAEALLAGPVLPLAAILRLILAGS